MIVDVTGFGWSGSGAVHDLLREYDDVKFASFKYDWEFTLLWDVDGIYDLEHKLCHKHCRYGDSEEALDRFLKRTEAMNHVPALQYEKIYKGKFFDICQKYADSLTQIKFRARNFREHIYPDRKEKTYLIADKFLGNSLIKAVFGKSLTNSFFSPSSHLIRFSYNPDKFLERTHLFMEELLSYVRDKDDYDTPLITDQMFPPDCPSMFFKYIREPKKCIIVRRDPRDTYLLAKRRFNSVVPIPVDTVEDFILFYKKTIEETKIPDTDDILNVRFEDLIYNYESTKKKIEDFIGIGLHKRERQYFNPNISINNTQLFNLYDNIGADIMKIEDALPDSLFPFDNYPSLGKNRERVF